MLQILRCPFIKTALMLVLSDRPRASSSPCVRPFSNFIVHYWGLNIYTDTIGGITSPWIAGPIIDTLGRRAGMFIGCLTICIGKFIVFD